MFKFTRSFIAAGIVLVSGISATGASISAPNSASIEANASAVSFEYIDSASGDAAAESISSAAPSVFKAATVSRLRQALINVGAGNIPMTETTAPCGNSSYVACVNPSQGARIFVHPRLNTYAWNKTVFIMAHEYAHIVTAVYTPYGSKYNTPAYNAFGGNYERMADCMALVKLGYMLSSYGTTCSSSQRTYASRLWQGIWT